ncbi:MAG: peptidyl-prolyl cis-trans isomerase [Planctomycetaceae bacterium]
MRWTFAPLAILLLLSGCEWLDKLSTVKVDNPVMGPPPPRVAMTDDRLAGDSMLAQKDPVARGKIGGHNVLPVDFAGAKHPEKGELSPSLVVATVNGSPIFAADVLEPYTKQLGEFEHKLSPTEFNEAKLSLIKRDLPGHIQNRLVVSAVMTTLKKEQLEPLEKHLDELFKTMIDKKKRELGIHSDYELDLKLQSQDGTSLASLRTTFHNRGMAQAYLESKSKTQQEELVTRPELLAYYEEHIAEYSFPASVNWQQIAVSFGKHGGKQQAFEIFEKAVEALKQSRGANFDEVARRYSDDPKADQGGRWGWTKQGSLADKKIDKLLFELPVGTISAPVVGEDAFRIVKVNERKPAGRVPFADVQNDIKKTLTRSRQKESSDVVLAKLRENATITTIFDGEQQKKADELPFE